jgi:hypothetical protein
MRPPQVVTISRFMAPDESRTLACNPPPSGLRLNNPPCQMEPLGWGDRGRCANSLRYVCRRDAIAPSAVGQAA